jgi:hypothetical protein
VQALEVDLKTGNSRIDLTPQSFEAARHESTNLVLWLKRDEKKMRGITDIALSFNETEETRQYIHIK